MLPKANRWAVAGSGCLNTPRFIYAKSGLEVDVNDDLWILLPNNGKGRHLRLGWLHNSPMSSDDKEVILSVLINYVRNKSASTVVTVATNIKVVLADGVPSLAMVEAKWSGFKTNIKKGLNQFFFTSTRLGYKQYQNYHEFTSAHLDKCRTRNLDSRRGALSAIEFDSLAKNVNINVRHFDWSSNRELKFYQTSRYFGHVRNQVSNKLLVSIVRRPVQLSLIKWSDLIPMGSSFHDPGIPQNYEVGSIGALSLQLRIFHVKSEGMAFIRETPELHPLYLSEVLSKLLVDYKRFLAKGILLLLESGGCMVDPAKLPDIMNNMPMFPDTDLFHLKLQSVEFARALFTPRSTTYHVSESSIALAIKAVSFSSDRMVDAIATSNRIRHTVMTRAAQDGLPVAQLAKITGVTVPAARHYVDLDYISRQMIDERFVGNLFLKTMFSSENIPENELVLDSRYYAVGAARDIESCTFCTSVGGRPLACYGCPNFRPFLEADHSIVLAQAESKLEANRKALAGQLHGRSLERIENQIVWLKATISTCDDILSRVQTLHEK